MYYRLQHDRAEMSQYWEATNNSHLRMSLGLLIDVAEDEVKVPFQFSVSYSPGLDGNPKVQPLYEYVSNVNVMSKRLVAALQAAGVDNLQVFPAVVTDTVTGLVNGGFVAVNVVGNVAVVNLARSSGEPIGKAYYFDKIAIDATKAQGLLLFRIKPSPIEIIIHESVAKVVEAGAFRGVTLESASDNPPGP